MKLRHTTVASIFGLVGLVSLAPSAFAAEAAPAIGSTIGPVADNTTEIVVTAQRRAERQVDVPITVAAISQAQLQTANVSNLADITKLTPALRFDNASAFFQPTIRGVGTAVTTSGGGSNVGIYIDGFYSPNPLSSDFQLLNVENVQVLKGPQGTLFGHNTTGGAIQVTTAEPSHTTKLDALMSYGRFDEFKAQAYATTGLTQDIAFDVGAIFARGNGWLTDITTGQRAGDWQNWSVRTGVKFDVSPNVSVLIRYQHSDSDDPNPGLTASYFDPVFGSGAPAFAAAGEVTYNPRQTAQGPLPQDQVFIRMKSDIVQGTIKADLGFANLTSYSQYRKETVDSNIMLDYSGAAVFRLGLPNFNKTWSQELLLTSKSGGKLQWTAGFFAFGNVDTYVTYVNEAILPVLTDADQPPYSATNPAPVPVVAGVHPVNVPFSPGERIGGSGTNTQSYAGYLDVTYEVMPRLFLTAGGRYSHDLVTSAYYNLGAAAVPVAGIHSDHFTPRAVIRYKPDDESSVYFSYSQGYKAAIIDVGGSCQNAVNIPTASNPTGAGYTCNNVQPEKIDAFEVGYKFDNHRISAELSGFYYNYRNLQISEYLSGTANIINAAKSEIYGIDFQSSAKLTSQFSVNVAAAWVHARYKAFYGVPIYTSCGSPVGCFGGFGAGTSFFIPGGLNSYNTTMQRTPEFTANLGATYKTEVAEGELALSGNLNYTSKFYFGPSGTQFPQDGYATLDARAQWTTPDKHYHVAVYGNNIANAHYKTEVQYSSFGIGSNWAKPTTYGIEVGAKF